jgi:hypothetical protein
VQGTAANAGTNAKIQKGYFRTSIASLLESLSHHRSLNLNTRSIALSIKTCEQEAPFIIGITGKNTLVGLETYRHVTARPSAALTKLLSSTLQNIDISMAICIVNIVREYDTVVSI